MTSARDGLEILGVTAVIGRNVAVRDATMCVQPGESIAVLGPNGAGKTSLMRAVSGTLELRAGEIRFGGLNLTKIKPWKRSELGIAHVPQGRRCFGPLSVRDNLRMGAYTNGGRFKQNVAEVLHHFPQLEAKFSDPAASLSGGQQQMLAIARALMSEPRLLLLDEPSLGLAPLYVQQVGALLRVLRERSNLSVLLAEQNLALVRSAADEYQLLLAGVLSSERSPVSSLTQEDLAKAYLGVGEVST